MSYLVKKMIEHWNYSADNVLHHFRSIFRGEVPLATADRDLNHLVERENLDLESKAYVIQVLGIIKDQGICTSIRLSFFLNLVRREVTYADRWEFSGV